jgi:hypothetical protein
MSESAPAKLIFAAELLDWLGVFGGVPRDQHLRKYTFITFSTTLVKANAPGRRGERPIFD